MTDRSTFDSFEQRIAGELERYVAPAADPKPAAEIADMAMRPRGLVVRARNASWPRRFLLLGLAAAFLVPAAYVGAIINQPPAPDTVNQVQPSPSGDPRATAEPSALLALKYVSIFVRREDGPEPGLSIFAVRPDGGEALVRNVPDSIVPGRGTLSQWGAVSELGWLALGVKVQGGPYPMILIDLGDEHAPPWVINEANVGGIGPRWGPTGLLAAYAGPSSLVIADPESRETRIFSMHGDGLVGSGPSIIWTADGSGIVGSKGSGAYSIHPLDGGDPSPGVAQVFDRSGSWGPGLSSLQICVVNRNCLGGDDGRIERIEFDGSAQTIWQQDDGGDRALAASFGARPGEYWLTLDHDKGRQVALVHAQVGRQDVIATVNRAADWQYAAAPVVAPDQSTILVWIDVGAKPAAVLVPLAGAPPTFHSGHFAGFVDRGASTQFTNGQYGAPAETIPAAGEAYALPPLDELIAAELGRNPSRRVLGKAYREAVDGETEARTFEVPRDHPGVAGEVHLDCVGPSSVTVASGPNSVTSPCLRAGSYGGSIDATGPIIVTASGDTSWRVVIYSP